MPHARERRHWNAPTIVQLQVLSRAVKFICGREMEMSSGSGLRVQENICKRLHLLPPDELIISRFGSHYWIRRQPDFTPTAGCRSTWRANHCRHGERWRHGGIGLGLVHVARGQRRVCGGWALTVIWMEPANQHVSRGALSQTDWWVGQKQLANVEWSVGDNERVRTDSHSELWRSGVADLQWLLTVYQSNLDLMVKKILIVLFILVALTDLLVELFAFQTRIAVFLDCFAVFVKWQSTFAEQV